MKITFDIMRSYRNIFEAAKELGKELFKFELGSYVGQESKYLLQARFIQNFILTFIFCLLKNYSAATVTFFEGSLSFGLRLRNYGEKLYQDETENSKREGEYLNQ